jgi:hypothetical protein
MNARGSDQNDRLPEPISPEGYCRASDLNGNNRIVLRPRRARKRFLRVLLVEEGRQHTMLRVEASPDLWVQPARRAIGACIWRGRAVRSSITALILTAYGASAPRLRGTTLPRQRPTARRSNKGVPRQTGTSDNRLLLIFRRLTLSDTLGLSAATTHWATSEKCDDRSFRAISVCRIQLTKT